MSQDLNAFISAVEEIKATLSPESGYQTQRGDIAIAQKAGSVIILGNANPAAKMSDLLRSLSLLVILVLVQ